MVKPAATQVKHWRQLMGDSSMPFSLGGVVGKA